MVFSLNIGASDPALGRSVAYLLSMSLTGPNWACAGVVKSNANTIDKRKNNLFMIIKTTVGYNYIVIGKISNNI
jgi:hypothetical protein